MAGINSAARSADTTSTSSPIARARLAPRCSSMNCSRLEAKRRLPTVLKIPSLRYNSML